MRNSGLGLGVGIVLALVATAARAQLVIDDFEQDGFSLQAANGNTDSVDLFSAAYFGGFRQVFIQGSGAASTAVSAPGLGDDSVVLTTGGGANLTCSYGDATPNVDLSAFDAVEIVMSAAPSSGLVAASFTNGAQFATANLPLDGPGTYTIPYTAMDPGATFDFTGVDRVSASILALAVSGETFAISEIRLVPEPGASAACGLASLGAIAALRRRRG